MGIYVYVCKGTEREHAISAHNALLGSASKEHICAHLPVVGTRKTESERECSPHLRNMHKDSVVWAGNNVSRIICLRIYAPMHLHAIHHQPAHPFRSHSTRARGQGIPPYFKRLTLIHRPTTGIPNFLSPNLSLAVKISPHSSSWGFSCAFFPPRLRCWKARQTLPGVASPSPPQSRTAVAPPPWSS